MYNDPGTANLSDTRIRVLIVDDQQRVRYSLGLLLRVFSDIEHVGEAWDGREAITACALHRPHVVLMDLDMPRMDGVQATHTICRSYPSIRVVILTSEPDISKLESALAAGAVGVLRKDASIDEIAEAIRSAAAL